MRKTKEDRPVVAICYDFDKTLSPDDMQAQGYIQSVGYEVDKFWAKSNELATENGMDSNLAYMYLMMEEARGTLVFNRKALEDYGSKVKLFPGADTWFERIRKYGEEHGVIVEHYIISSGLKEMIEGTSVAKAGAFEQIYASSFLYDDRGLAIWPAHKLAASLLRRARLALNKQHGRKGVSHHEHALVSKFLQLLTHLVCACLRTRNLTHRH